MKDIEGREDIDLLVDTFYGKVQKDAVIGPFFNDVAKVNWDEHLPHLKDFWEAGLFHTVGFKGQAFLILHLGKILQGIGL